MNMAIGMVAKTVKVPHGLSASALTTTSASTASRMTMIMSTPMRAMVPAAGPFRTRIMSPSERPSRRVEGAQHDEVLHGAGEHDAGEHPQRARQIAHLRREHGADQRAGAGDGREVVAEQHVAVGRHVVEPIVVADGRRRARWRRAAARGWR